MQQLLATILLFNTIGVVRGNAFMLVPGLSVKNALLYAAVSLIFMRGLLGKRLRVELPGVLAALGLLVAYALVSALVVANSEVYPRYQLIASIVRIKGDQLDWLCFFTAYTVGVSTRAEVLRLLKILLALVGIANVITIWNAVGLPRIGMDVYNPEVAEGLRRINGFFGHANETGSMIVTFLPLFIAIMGAARGAWRVFWLGLTVATCMVLVGTVSRGALVGMIGGAIFASLAFPKYVSIGRFVRWGAVALLLGMLVLPFVGTGYLEKFSERFTGVSTVSATDISSGRTELWTMGVTAMLRHPWSLVTGMGWNTWAVQGFNFLPHSHYLWMYFDMGIVGVGCFVYVFASVYGIARKAVLMAPDAVERRLPLAFAFAVPTWMICIVFSNIGVPWIFVWPLMGLMARYSYLSIAESRRKSSLASDAGSARPAKYDRFGLPKRAPSKPALPTAARPAGRR